MFTRGVKRGQATPRIHPPCPHFLRSLFLLAYLKTQVINIWLTLGYKYWWVVLSHTHTKTHTFSTEVWTLTAPNWNQREIQTETWSVFLSFSHTQIWIHRYENAIVTCVDVKELVLLEFLLLLLLGLFPGQLGSLDLLFSLLPLLILLHCLLVGEQREKGIRECM